MPFPSPNLPLQTRCLTSQVPELTACLSQSFIPTPPTQTHEAIYSSSAQKASSSLAHAGAPLICQLVLRHADAHDTDTDARDFPWSDGSSPLSSVFLLQLLVLSLEATGQKNKAVKGLCWPYGVGFTFLQPYNYCPIEKFAVFGGGAPYHSSSSLFHTSTPPTFW